MSWTVTLGDILGSGIASAVVAAFLLRRNTTIESEIKTYFDQRLKVFESTRAWQEKALSELFGPMILQLERTRRAFERWRSKNKYLEMKILREGNIAVRDLLLGKAHLIPPYLMRGASDLVVHYDRWLEEFEKARVEKNPTEDQEFVFVGPDGYPFPRKAESEFIAEFKQLQVNLYGALATNEVRAGEG